MLGKISIIIKNGCDVTYDDKNTKIKDTNRCKIRYVTLCYRKSFVYGKENSYQRLHDPFYISKKRYGKIRDVLKQIRRLK